MENTTPTYQFDFESLLSILKRKKWVIIASLLVSLALAALYIWKTTPVYRAQATIVFELHQGPVSLINPFRTTLPASYITNQIEEIKSRALAEEVIEKLPQGILLTIPLPKKRDKLFDEKEYIAAEIQRHISATPVPNSDVIKITAEATSPIAAKVIANTVAEVFQERNLQVRREETSNVRQIIEEQLAMFKNRLDSAEIALKQFKEKTNVTVIDKEAEEIYKRITEAEILYNKTKADLDAAEKRLSFIKTKLAQERKDLVPTITEISSPWTQKLKEQLVELQSQYTKLKLQNYQDDHPKVRDLLRQIGQIKKELKVESLKIASGENIVDPITQIQRYLEEIISLEIEIQAYKAQVKTLGDVISTYKRNLNTIPDKELRLAKLIRDKQVNEKVYMMLLNKREEARIAEAEKVGDIRILDPAKTPRSHYKPRKKFVAFLAFVFGITFGVGIAFLSEALDTSLKSAEEAERFTQLKVLATIPEIEPDVALSRDKYYKPKHRKDALEIVRRLVTSQPPESIDSDAFRGLTINLQLVNMDTQAKTILITSSSPGEGKSLVAANLAITSANMGLKTLLIDADILKPIQHQVFKLRQTPGLIELISVTKTNMLKNTQKSEAKASMPDNGNLVKIIDKIDDIDIVEDRLSGLDYIFNHNSELIREQAGKIIIQTKVKNLDVLPSGSSNFHFSNFLASRILRNIFFELEKEYDAIFIDTAPIGLSTIARLLSAVADGVILVARAGKTPRREIMAAKKTLQHIEGKIIGIVLNRTDLGDQLRKYMRYYKKSTTSNA